jgi:spore cortex biosynthesis protein YabQ
MNQVITVELQFFLISVLWGSIILLAYDGLRILRRLIKHGVFFLAVEDIIFWVAASLFIFSMIYKQNNGIIRGFSVMGMSLGMVVYHFLIKDYLVNFIAKCIHILLRPLAFAVKTVKKFIHYLLLKGNKIVKFFTGQLKKSAKSVKISVQRKNQVLTSKRMKRKQERMAAKKSKKKAAENNKNPKKAGKHGQPKSDPTTQPVRPYRPEPTLRFERVNINPQTREYETADRGNHKTITADKDAKPVRSGKHK